MINNSNILLLPGLGNSGPLHWQSVREAEFGMIRINQVDWDTPVCDDWTAKLHAEVLKFDPATVILVGHSLACATVACWSHRYNTSIKGALLVAPSDTEAPTYPPGTEGFTPVPLNKLPFRSIVVASTDDYYVSISRAKTFAAAWGSEFHDIGAAGHINAASNLGRWEHGLTYLNSLTS